MSNINLQNITKKFGDLVALNDISFTVEDGEFFVLLGPTGAGKTTTLRVIAGLEKQEEGSVLFDDETMNLVPPGDRDVAFVFQQYSLYPNMSVYDNLAFPLRAPSRKMPEDDIRKQVEHTANLLHIDHLLDRKTAHLSGGEMQRVSIGRAIVREPRVYLMDEPLSNLDAKLRELLRVELQHLQKTQNSTTLFVTHDQVEALTMADRIAVLNEGKIIQVGTPNDIYDRPATTFVAELVGTPRINLLPSQRENDRLTFKDSNLHFPIPEFDLPQSFLLGIRPEDITPHPQGEFSGRIALIEPLGVETILRIMVNGHTILSLVPGMTHLDVGDEIRFNTNLQRLHYFDMDGKRVLVKSKQV